MASKTRTRRAFLGEAALLGAAGVAAGCVKPGPAVTGAGAAANPATVPERRVLGANERIRCGFIGVGNRGSVLLRGTLDLDGVDVAAVCDTYDVWRSRAVSWCREARPDVRDYIRYEDMLDAGGLDAVVIATPDHIHAPAALAALDAGLDVYCEKPVALTAQDALRVRRRARETGAVFQTGTQLRSLGLYRKAREVFESGGLGALALVQVHRHIRGQRLTEAVAPNEATRANVHWDAFLAGAPKRDFDPVRYFHWRFFRDYSNGYFGGLMLHHLDQCHFITGCPMPAQILAAGGVYGAEDGRTTPDTVSALADYGAQGFHFNYATTDHNDRFGLVERYIGAEGAIEIRGMSQMDLFRGDAKEQVHAEGDANTAHLRDFFEAMRTRGETAAPVEAGFMGAACAHMAMLSAGEHRAVAWDPHVEAPVM